ncbi:hypothetical protein [Bacillus mycoides]|uniref:hypothetical protein n=1 Tax=Bacillus mycoides TaxID=1405 RepID=UPI00292EAA35|nr:hypothetical protein [Bacillus mycoides]WOA61012.1 hypothetical protein RVY74_32115 [Bacillus mycoides]
MNNTRYINENGKVVSGGAADQHFLKEHIENESLLTFIQDTATEEFKNKYIKTKADLIELGEMLKMYSHVSSDDGVIFNLDAPYIYDKHRMRDLLEALNLNYRIGDEINNSVIREVW